MTLEESSKQVKIIDKKIEQFAQYLQRKNNLDHIQFLKILFCSLLFTIVHLKILGLVFLFSSNYINFGAYTRNGSPPKRW